MGLQPTASNTGLLLQCPRPFDPEVEIPEEAETVATRRRDEAARYGDGFHALLEKHVQRGKDTLLQTIADKVCDKHEIPEGQRRDLVVHVQAAWRELRTWLSGENPFDVDFFREMGWATEISYALRPGRSYRPVDPPDDDYHIYPDLQRGEIGMTIDLELASPDWSLIIDYKSGRLGDWSSPALVPQMRTMGLAPVVPSSDVDANDETHGRVVPQKVYLAVLDASRAGIPAVYGDLYEEDEQRKHEKSLRKALSLIGSGYIRPGPLCPRCPVKASCPALAVDLVKEGTALIEQAAGGLVRVGKNPKMTVADRLGKFHQLKSEMYKLLERLDTDVRRGVEELEKQGVIVIRPDGKPLLFEDRLVERIAGKRGFEEVLGKVEAARWFAKLRKLGVMVEKKERHLRAVEDRKLLR